MAEKIYFNGFTKIEASKFGTKLSAPVDKLIEEINKHAKNGWINLELLESKAGKKYLQVDTWEKKTAEAETTNKDKSDLPR